MVVIVGSATAVVVCILLAMTLCTGKEKYYARALVLLMLALAALAGYELVEGIRGLM